MKQTSIVLGVDNDSDMHPLFACPIPPENEESVQEAFKGRFLDMRRALFSLSDEEHQLVTRVSVIIVSF